MDFLGILAREGEVVDAYFAAIQAAHDCRELERCAATTIQSSWRCSVVMGRYHDVLWATRQIQRYGRSHLGRRKAQTAELDQHRRRNSAFFGQCATVVQRHFRGHWSRKYWHHMRARASYLRSVEKRGNRTNRYLQKAFAEASAEYATDQDRRLREEFAALTSQLHHLVSTSQVPGVYNPPYSDVLPSAFGEPVERHLRRSNQVRLPGSLRRPAHRARSIPPRGRLRPVESAQRPSTADEERPRQSATAAVGRLRPIQGPFRTREEQAMSNAHAYKQYRSVQCDGAYDAVRENERMSSKISKMARAGAEDFVLRKVSEKPYLGAIHAESAYAPRPVEFREDYVEVAQMGNRPPFYLGMPAGKMFHEYEDPKRHITLQGGT